MTAQAFRRVYVHLPGSLIGELAQDRYGRVHWTPNQEWESNGQIPRLGFDFLRTPGPRTTTQDLPSWFENLLPERESALRERLTSMFGLRDGQSFELLAALGKQLPGAVEVLRAEDSANGDERPLDSEQILVGQDSPLSNEEDQTTRLSSLAGVQLKFSMSMVNERLSFGARRGRNE